jgi:glucose/arabinose dehydrogenase
MAVAAMTVAGIAVIAPAVPAAAVDVPSGYVSETVAAGLDQPTAIAKLPDGRFLVLEKAGRVRVVKNGQLLAAPFADLTAQVNDYWDRGLTGIAVDPNFASNGFVYLFFPYDVTGVDGSGPVNARLVRLTASGDVTAAGSQVVLLGTSTTVCGAASDPTCIPQDWYGHSADSLRFAADGTLFVSLGDAASWDYADDRALRAQDIDQYPGKVLHVTTAGKGVSGNPFWNGNADAIRSKVWAYGLRNPFRMSLNPSSGLPYVGDVGWDTTEEIDVAAAGANLGWPCYEGNARQTRYEPMAGCQTLYAKGSGVVTFPAYSWNHDGTGSAAVGGPFTPAGSTFGSAYANGMFFADYARNQINFLPVSAGGSAGNAVPFATNADGPVDLAFGDDGNLYYVAINAGELRRFRSTGSSTPPPPPPGSQTTFLSDLTPVGTPVNGWGPYERDRSNGEQNAGDGRTLTIAGVTYAKGLGVHATSDIRYSIPSTCTLAAQAGVDDEVGNSGSVRFEVWNGTSARLYQSPVKYGWDGPASVSVALTGVTSLRLVVTDAGDGNGADHADWADAKVSCGTTPTADTTPPVISNVSAAPTSNTVTVTWTTDEPADSRVEYGATSAYGSFTPLDGTRVTSHSQSVTGLTPGATYHYRVRSADASGNAALSGDRTFTTASGTGGSVTYLSDLAPTGTPVNGWGPYERDRSNGEAAAGDGGPLTIEGSTYAKGLGVHAQSELVYAVPSGCTTFTAQAGVDDEVGLRGSVVFEVWNGTAARLYQSPTKTGAQAATAVSVPLSGVSSLRLVVTDAGDGNNYDHADWAGAQLACGGTPNSPPVPTMTSPAAGLTTAVGDTVSLAGSATDAEDGAIPAASLTWQVTLFHCVGTSCHTHPILTVTGATGSFVAPDHSDDSYVRVQLTARDSAGATATVSRDLQPRKVALTLASSPSGLQVSYDGVLYTTPVVVNAVVGATRTLDTPSPQGALAWQAWSDGQPKQHVITVPSVAKTYTATFATVGGTGPTTTYLSDLTPSSTPVNGWGPYERDMSNGEAAAGDGLAISIAGTTYPKGLGVHAASDIRYTIAAGCTLAAAVGVDDEVGLRGSVVFEVWNGTATRLYQSVVKHGGQAATPISVPLTGVTSLRLVVTDGGDGNYNDHGDWGAARITCS